MNAPRHAPLPDVLTLFECETCGHWAYSLRPHYPHGKWALPGESPRMCSGTPREVRFVREAS